MTFAFGRQQAAANISKKSITTSAISMRNSKEIGPYTKTVLQIQRPHWSDHSNALTSPTKQDLGLAIT